MVFSPHYTTSVNDSSAGATADWYYVRAVQSGQLAWSSPIWVDAASNRRGQSCHRVGVIAC